MKKKGIQFILASVVCILFATCRKEATNIELPTADPQLIVISFISPQDSLINVSVSLSKPVFQNNHSSNSYPIEVENATVIISDGTNSKIIPYDYGNKYKLSASEFPIVAGKTYYLTVTTPDGKAVSSNCKVPISNLNYASTSIDSSINSNESIVYNVQVKFNDIINEVNYYKFGGIIKYQYWLVFSDEDSTLGSRIDIMNYTDGNSLLNDENNVMNYQVNMYSSNFNSPETFNKSIKIYILNIDEEFYKFEKWLDTQEAVLLFTEPTTAFTNINGGYGVFCAYQRFEMTMPL